MAKVQMIIKVKGKDKPFKIKCKSKYKSLRDAKIAIPELRDLFDSQTHEEKDEEKFIDIWDTPVKVSDIEKVEYKALRF